MRRLEHSSGALGALVMSISEALCGAANPGCSRLSAGSRHPRTRRFPLQETFPKGSFPARVNALRSRAGTSRDESRHGTQASVVDYARHVEVADYARHVEIYVWV